MRGWLYLIKNGDLYKIGITKNIENRMRQLKPDKVISKLYSSNYKKLERELHMKYKDVRIPQTEYFRLDKIQIKEIKNRIGKFNFSRNIIFDIFKEAYTILLFSFFILVFLKSLVINDFKIVIVSSLLLMERFSFLLSLLSILINSGKYLSFLNEFRFRLYRLTIFILFGFFFRLTSIFLYNT